MRGNLIKIEALGAAILLGAALLVAARVEMNHPTGTAGLFMVDKVGAQIRFFDPQTFREQSSFEAPVNPHDFVFSADHKLAYVPIYGDGVYGNNPHPGHQIAMVDLANRKLAGLIDIAPHRAPHGIQIAPNGTLYVTCDLDRQVLVIDPTTRTITGTIENEGTGHWIAILPDASKLYVTNKTDRPFISVLDLKTLTMAGKVPVPNGTEGIAASPDGKTVVAIDHSDPVIIVIDPKTDQATARIPLQGQARGAYKVYFSPDGKRLVTISMAARLVNVFDATNLRGEQKTLPTGKDPMGLAFSADGRTLLVANHGDGSVSVMDLQKMEAVKTFHAGTGIETLSYY